MKRLRYPKAISHSMTALLHLLMEAYKREDDLCKDAVLLNMSDWLSIEKDHRRIEKLKHPK